MILLLALLGRAEACSPLADPYTQVCVDRSGSASGSGNCVSKSAVTVTLTESFTLSERALVQLDDLTLTAQGYYPAGGDCPVYIDTMTLRLNSSTLLSQVVNETGPTASSTGVHLTRAYSPDATHFVELGPGTHSVSLVVTGTTTSAGSELRARLQAALRYGRDFDGDGYNSALLSDCDVACDPDVEDLHDGCPCDCDDLDPDINPAADEVCDGVDNDCDGSIDVDAIDAERWYADVDGDGFGDPATFDDACEAPPGYVANDDDCDDDDATIKPGATEIPGDGVDQDCDELELCFEDVDGDTYRTDTAKLTAVLGCDSGAWRLATVPGGDCDDTNAAINPGATEIVADGVDQDCDGFETCYQDLDNDDWRTTATTSTSDIACAGAGLALATMPSIDCDDLDPDVNPGADEVCDGKDNDCDTRIDVDAIDAPTWYLDADGDTFGDAGTSAEECAAPTGYVANPDDCDDGDAATYPGAPEVCDGAINDCDASTLPDDEADLDGDRYVVCLFDADTWRGDSTIVGGLDCDDGDASTYPGAAEICDGAINDCDASTLPDDEADLDGDRYVVCPFDPDSWRGDSLVVGGLDCDDGDPLTFPGATERCDGVINDCRASILADDEADLDGDRYVVCAYNAATWRGASTILGGLDCDDGDALTFPGATEIIADGKDQSCDGTEICYQDLDGDRWRTTLTTVTADIACAGAGLALASMSSVDCDDADPDTFPGATQIIGDGKDQTCGGEETCYQDLDGDGWRTDETTVTTTISCIGGGLARAVTPDGDCDDDDPLTFPGATEIVADGKDQSCDGLELCYRDRDGDRWRTDTFAATAVIGCDTDGWALATMPAVDCDDDDADTFPGAAEIVADGKDQDCDGLELCYEDLDDDGWRTDETTASIDLACASAGLAPDAAPRLDCDDENAAINPGAEEIWYDGVDQDCDGWSDFDQDLDGFDSDAHERLDGTFGDDCDDLEPAIHPDAVEVWYDGVDQDCDGWSDFDQDLDGYDARSEQRPDGTNGDDCDDLDDTIFPGVRGLTDDCQQTVEQDDSRALPPPPPGVTPGPVGCACDATATGSPLGWLAGLGMLGALWRRRRAG